MNEPAVIEVLTVLALAQLTLCAVLAWMFVILYCRVAWWTTREGRHLMRFTIAFALMLSATLLFTVVPVKPITQLILSVALFGWVSWELANRSWLHLQAVRENKEALQRAAEAKTRDE